MKNILNLRKPPSIYAFIILIAVFNILLSILFMLFSQFINYENYSLENTAINAMTPTGILVLTVLVGPLLETYIIQFLIIELFMTILSKYKKNIRYLGCATVSAASFALIHNFNYLYILETFAIGFILAFCYIHIRLYYQKNSWTAFFAIFFIHSFHNLFAFIYNDLF